MANHLEKNIYLYLVLVMIIWGVSWPVSKILTSYTDTSTLLFLKFFIGVLSLLPIIFTFAQKSKITSKLIIFLFSASLFLILYNIFFFVGIKIGYASVGGVFVTSFNPLITFAIIAFFEKTQIPKLKKLSLFLGLVSGLIILRVWDISYANFFDSGNVFFLFASLSWSLVTIISSKAKNFMNSLLFTFYIYLFTSIATFFATDMTKIIEIFSFDYIFWVSLIFTTVLSAGLATTFYFKASTIIGANHTSSFLFLVPIVALVSSSIILDEPIHLHTLLGGVIAIVAIYLLNK